VRRICSTVLARFGKDTSGGETSWEFKLPGFAPNVYVSAFLVKDPHLESKDAFMPDRAFVPDSTNPMNNINTVDLPVNVGVIKGGKDVILYDSGWKQQDYHKMTGTEHWAPLPDQLKLLGINAGECGLRQGHRHHRCRCPWQSAAAACGA